MASGSGPESEIQAAAGPAPSVPGPCPWCAGSHGALPVPRCPNDPSHKDASKIRSGPPPSDPTFNTSLLQMFWGQKLKIWALNKSGPTLGTWGLGFKHRYLGGTIQPITPQKGRFATPFYRRGRPSGSEVGQDPDGRTGLRVTWREAALEKVDPACG